MKDNLSIVISMVIFVILIVIFPLYNYFERQDDMSYNLALKTTTNFVDEVTEAGYLDQDAYNRFVEELSDTGNVYDIQLEAHRKLLTKDNNSSYNEQYLIDYNDQIFSADENKIKTNLNEKTIKDNAYYFNEGDQFYVKLKNSNTTMAGAIFNTIVPSSKKDRIVVNYGGIIKNQAWAKVDATYRDVLSINDNAPTIILNNKEELNIKADDNLNGQTIYLSANNGSTYNKTLKFSAKGPDGFIKNWHATLTNYLWKTDDSGSWQEINKDAEFEISNLKEGKTYMIYVKAVDKNNNIFSDEAKVTIVVKKRITMILAGLGWRRNSINWDVDLHFYITKATGEKEKIDYTKTNTKYGTLSGDDKTGLTDRTNTFYNTRNLPDTINKDKIKTVNEYILMSETNGSINNFKNLEDDDANKIDIYVNSFTSGTAFNRVLNENTINYVNTDVIILYADNTYDRTIQRDFSKFDKTVRIATLQRTNNEGWILIDKNVVETSLGG